MDIIKINKDLDLIVAQTQQDMKDIMFDDDKFSSQYAKDYGYLVTLELLAEKIKHYTHYYGEGHQLFRERYMKYGTSIHFSEVIP